MKELPSPPTAAPVPGPLLVCEAISVRYGAVRALENVSLEIAFGELIAVIGANGAGKSTWLSALLGEVPLSAGRILWRGAPLTHLPPYARARLGLALVPEGRGIVLPLSVADNLALGAWLLPSPDQRQAAIESAYARYPRLAERRSQVAGTLSGGELQMLALARALLSRPQLLLLDEPSLGLAPKRIGELFEWLAELSREGLTIVLVEQNARAALELATRGVLLSQGRVVRDGPARELLASQEVQREYLGL